MLIGTMLFLYPFLERVGMSEFYPAYIERAGDAPIIETMRTATGVESIILRQGSGCGRTCKLLLEDGSYRFVENESTRHSIVDLVEGKGNFRFSLTKQPDKDCNAYDLWLRTTPTERTKKRVNDYCIATTKIDEFQSDYEVTITEETEENFFVKTAKTKRTIRDVREPDSYVSKHLTYDFVYRGFATTFFGRSYVRYPYGMKYPRITDILKNAPES